MTIAEFRLAKDCKEVARVVNEAHTKMVEARPKKKKKWFPLTRRGD